MRTLRFTLAALLVVAFGAYGEPRPQTAASRDVRVHIVDGLTGQPVPRVRFTLTGAGLVDALTGSGDAQGDVVLTGVPRSGSYQLTITKAGYFDGGYPLNISSGSSITLPDIVLTAKREISGIVRWQDGEVAARAQVRTMGVRGGKAVNRNDVPAVATNDRGEFIVSNLRPGRYILLVSPPSFTGGIDPSGRFVAGGVPRLGVPVFYPGVNAPDARVSLDVRSTLNVQNIGIVLEEKPGTMVEGMVIPSPTAPAGSDVSITLNNAGLLSVSTRARSGDAFRIGPVPSGFYVLDAQSQGSGQASRTLLSLTVGGSVLRGVAVSIPPPVALSGQVEIDDPAVRPTASLRIQSEKISGTLASSAAASGDFRIPLTVAGETYGLTVTGIPPNAYVAEVSQSAQEKATSPFQVVAGGDPVRVVLKTDGGTIEGTAPGPAFVVVAPKDRRIEHAFRTTTTASDGTFKLSALAPGDYDVFAFDRNEDDDYLDELFLRGFADKAVEVKVAPRSTRTVEVPVTNIPRR